MREPESPPELADWPEDDSPESFVIVHAAEGDERKQRRRFNRP